MMDDKSYAQQALVQLRGAVDKHFDAALSRQPHAMQCELGCSGCCKPGLSVFSLEAARIVEALHTLSQNAPTLRETIRVQGENALREGSDPARCPLLVEDRCSVYAERPLICRSHGLPVMQDADASIRNCSLNYQKEAPERASVLRLDAINMPLSVSAELWHRPSKKALRVSLASLAAGKKEP